MYYRKDETKVVRIREKSWELPVVLPFRGEILKHDWNTYVVVAFRKPKRGEYYLSGSPVEVWKAFSNLSTEFLVVQRKERVVEEKVWRVQNEGGE